MNQQVLSFVVIKTLKKPHLESISKQLNNFVIKIIFYFVDLRNTIEYYPVCNLTILMHDSVIVMLNLDVKILNRTTFFKNLD